MLIVSRQFKGYAVSFYGARNGKTFDCWSSRPMSYARAIRLKLRIERRHRKAIRPGQITRTVESDASRQRYTVVRIDGWRCEECGREGGRLKFDG